MSNAVALQIAGRPLPGGQVLADVVIRSGRERADDGLNPASATVNVLSSAPAGAGVAIADALVVTVDGAPRFTGRVSEITAAAQDAATSLWTIVAVGQIARLSRLTIPAPIAAETAADRANRLFTALGITAVVQGGTSYNVTAYGVAGDPPAAGDQVAAQLMSDTGCVIADRGDGAVLVQFPEARTSTELWTPNPAMTHVDLAWDQTDDVVNDVTATWGVAPGATGTVTASDSTSIARYDRHSVGLQTQLADAGSATRRANSLVARLAVPAWAIGDVQTWDPSFLGHGIGCVVTIAPLPGSAPVTAWQGCLEGWTETYAPDADGLISGLYDLAVGDLQHSAESLIWQNVTPAETWATVNPATSWQTALSNADL